MAVVNNLSPDVDNANTALPRLHARFAPTLYVEYINTMSLLHLGNIIFGLSGSLVGWISPTGYRAPSLDPRHVPRTNSVRYSTGHLGEYYGPSLRTIASRALPSVVSIPARSGAIQTTVVV